MSRLFAFAVCALLSSHAFAYSDEFATPKTWLEGYRPNYFLYGNPDSKIELSAKVQLFEEHRLYFAYSQTMFWDIRESSSPMKDVNFNPELFYRFDLSGPAKHGSASDPASSPDDPSAVAGENNTVRAGRTWIDVGLFEHESNGQAGLQSRSWNRSYARYVLESRYDNTVRVYTSFKVWVPYTNSFDGANSDVLFYRGLYELELTAAGFFNDRSDVTLRLYAGGPSHLNPGAGGQELTFRFGTKTHLRFVPLWTFQIFNGVGEDFLNFRDRRTMFRAGLSF